MPGMNKEPRLRFTDEERADPALESPIRKAENAAKKAGRAQEKIPKKGVKKRTVDPTTGKMTVRLQFEDKKPPSKLVHHLQDTPAEMTANIVHKEIRESEDDNVGVESAHKSEEAAESAAKHLRDGYRSHKLQPYRKSARAEKKLQKANIQVLYQQSLQNNPQFSSNPISRMRQKQAIKRQYAAAKRSSQAYHAAGQAVSLAPQAAKRTVQGAKQFLMRHRKGLGVVVAFLVMLCFLLNTVSSCSVMVQSVGSVLAGSTFPSQDADMLGAEAAYAAMEAELQAYLDNYENTHDYDEYFFDLDEIGHDPYVLIAILSAYHSGEWTLPEVDGTLTMLFRKQYILTEDVTQEFQPATSPDPNGNPITTTEVYQLCHVTLKNMDLSHLPVYIMGEDKVSSYAVYMATLGNRPDLFPQSDFPHASVPIDPPKYDVPPEALADERFAVIHREAEKYLGYPYVWGGSNPSTSFDCSGYVSWVINHSGWNVGRLGAQGLCNLCTPVSKSNVRPGDLVFFKGTYDTPGVSHVGIYVGNDVMIHCGNPIPYTNLKSNYWQQHFYTYGRLPAP